DRRSGLEPEYEDPKTAVGRRNSTECQMEVGCRQVEASGLRIQRTGVSTHCRPNPRLDSEGTLPRLRYHDECSVTPTRNIKILPDRIEHDCIGLSVDCEVRSDDRAVRGTKAQRRTVGARHNQYSRLEVAGQGRGTLAAGQIIAAQYLTG